jgi:N6-L-threonylcarbamoyladenine synthase
VAHVAAVGGVAANALLRRRVEALGAAQNVGVSVPPLPYCMDNAAMIAQAGAQRLAAGHRSAATLGIDPGLHL